MFTFSYRIILYETNNIFNITSFTFAIDIEYFLTHNQFRKSNDFLLNSMTKYQGFLFVYYFFNLFFFFVIMA